MYLLSRLLSTLVLVVATTASAASFDCATARSVAEKLICSDSDLSKLDDELNSAYRRALSSAPNKTVISDWQRVWLARDVALCENVFCLRQVFAQRLSLLLRVAPKGNPSADWSGVYTRYWNGRVDRDSASVTLIGLNDGEVYIFGEAQWNGGRPGNFNIGQIDGLAKLNRGRLEFKIDGCNGFVMQTEKALLIENETGCGGLNVTLSGKYRKTKH